MTPPGFRRWLSPLVYLSNNWVSRAGVILVTTAVVLWCFLTVGSLGAASQNPYLGIVTYLVLPAVFFAGLIFIPVGIAWRKRREAKAGHLPGSFPSLDLRSPEVRNLLTFVAITTIANVVIAAQFSYRAVSYMDSTGFCGQACHTVMNPEFTAYHYAPHSNVECTHCHIGPGAESFVRSKFAGTRRLAALVTHSYARPIPSPVQDMRPAREICEECHSRGRESGEKLRVIAKFASDDGNVPSKTVLMMHVGGGSSGQGIHGAHLSAGIQIRYAYADARRESIPWVEYRDARGQVNTFAASDSKGPMPGNLRVREMDCLDCHNRPSHTYETPEGAVNRAMAAGAISPALPFAKQQSLELLQHAYASSEEAARKIPGSFDGYYRDRHAGIYPARRSEIAASAQTILAIYNRNIFPEMNITWGSYPNYLGHTDYPGCFRCHDDAHVSTSGAKITQDCNACHSALAVEEAAPKILSDLGIEK